MGGGAQGAPAFSRRTGGRPRRRPSRPAGAGDAAARQHVAERAGGRYRAPAIKCAGHAALVKRGRDWPVASSSWEACLRTSSCGHRCGRAQRRVRRLHRGKRYGRGLAAGAESRSSLLPQPRHVAIGSPRRLGGSPLAIDILREVRLEGRPMGLETTQTIRRPSRRRTVCRWRLQYARPPRPLGAQGADALDGLLNLGMGPEESLKRQSSPRRRRMGPVKNATPARPPNARPAPRPLRARRAPAAGPRRGGTEVCGSGTTARITPSNRPITLTTATCAQASAIAEQRRDRSFHRNEYRFRGGLPVGQGVVTGVDVVGPDLVPGNHQAPRAQRRHQPAGHGGLAAAGRRGGDNQARDGYRSIPFSGPSRRRPSGA